MAKRTLILSFGLWAGLMFGVTGCGTQKPDPDQAALLHPVERIAYSDDWRFDTVRKGRAGEMVFVILRTPQGAPCSEILVPDNVTLSQLLPLTTEAPSSEGTKAGIFYEIVAPRNDVTCHQSRYVLAEYRLGETPVVIIVAGQSLVIRSSLHSRPGKARPFFIGQGNANLVRGHCPDQWCAMEAALGHAYAQLFLTHGLQPMQNWVAVPPIVNGALDLDAVQDQGRSFRQLVMSYALSGWIGFPRASRYGDPVAYLKALEQTVRRENLAGRAWVYAKDEPSSLEDLRALLGLYRTYAPSVKVMVTTDYDPSLEGLVDIFAPVYNHLVSRKKPDVGAYENHLLWTYVSCAGSCGPNRAAFAHAPKKPGPDTGLADLLIDRPARRLFDFFGDVAAKNLDGVLYYEATEGYGLTRVGIDPLSDVWNFGGNGDGLLVFPGRPGQFGLKFHQPLASFRLKLIRHALNTYW